MAVPASVGHRLQAARGDHLPGAFGGGLGDFVQVGAPLHLQDGRAAPKERPAVAGVRDHHHVLGPGLFRTQDPFDRGLGYPGARIRQPAFHRDPVAVSCEVVELAVAGEVDEKIVPLPEIGGQFSQVADDLKAGGLFVGSKHDVLFIEPIQFHQDVSEFDGVLDRGLKGIPFPVLVDPDDEGVIGAQCLIENRGLGGEAPLGGKGEADGEENGDPCEAEPGD